MTPRVLILTAFLMLFILPVPALCQDSAAAELLRFPANLVISRTPSVDGVADAGEWINTYPIRTGTGQLRIGMSWDSSHLYVLIKGPKLAKTVLYIDAMADGWLNGADNYEITIVPGASEPGVTTKLYNSFVSSPSKALAPVVLGCKPVSRTTTDGTTIELAIDRSDSSGLVLAAGKKISFSVGAVLDSDPETMLPADPRASMQIVDLVDKMSKSIKGLSLDIKMRDRRLVPGQTLSLDFSMKNETETPVAFDSYVIGGEDRIGNLINSLRVRGDVLEPGKRLTHGFKTDLPQDMPVGAFLIKTEVHLSDKQIPTVLYGFEVVEFLDASLNLGNGPMAAGSEREIFVSLTNNRTGSNGGKVRLLLPPELASGLKRDSASFRMQTQNATAEVGFKLTVPTNTPAGEYDVKADIESGSYKRSLAGKLLVGK